MDKKTVIMRVPTEVRKQLREIKKISERSLSWIIKRAVNNYWKATIGNRLPKKD